VFLSTLLSSQYHSQRIGNAVWNLCNFRILEWRYKPPVFLTSARRERGKVLEKGKRKGQGERPNFRKISKAVAIWDSFNFQQSLQWAERAVCIPCLKTVLFQGI
jgi:hypothetical protein